MLIRNVFASAGAVALLVGFVGGNVSAQDGGSNWQAERAALQATVNQRVSQIIDQEVTKQKVAQFLQFGWPVEPPKERKDEIVKRIETEVEKAARAKFPEARRQAIPGVRLCVNCQSGRDRAWRPDAGINRRGSKDSQLK